MQVRTNSSQSALVFLVSLIAVFWAFEFGLGARRFDVALENQAISDGQWYRLILAHFVHLSQHHTFLNMLGVILVASSQIGILRLRWLVLSIGASMAMISLGWWILQPAGVVYVGFSGTLHGVFAVGGLTYLRRGPAWFGWVVVLALTAKLSFEILVGPVPGADDAIEGRVSTLSHGLGALGGALVAPWHWLAKPALIGLALVAVWAAVRHEAALYTAVASLF